MGLGQKLGGCRHVSGIIAEHSYQAWRKSLTMRDRHLFYQTRTQIVYSGPQELPVYLDLLKVLKRAASPTLTTGRHLGANLATVIVTPSNGRPPWNTIRTPELTGWSSRTQGTTLTIIHGPGLNNSERLGLSRTERQWENPSSMTFLTGFEMESCQKFLF